MNSACPAEAHVHAVCLLCVSHDHHGQDEGCQFVTMTCAEFAALVAA